MGREPQAPLGFHQGTVVSWDALAGTNTIRVLGENMNDLPSLIGSEVGLIRKDDVVGVLRFQNTYFVLGRIEGAGAAQRAFGVASQRVTGPGSAVSTSSTSFVALTGGPSVKVYIGSSRRCRVDVSSYVNGHDAIAYAGFEVSGASTITPTNRWSVAGGIYVPGVSNPDVWVNATRSINLSAADGLNEGENTFTMKYQCVGAPGTGVAQFSDREISVQPF